MSDPIQVPISVADQRLHVRQLFKAGDLSPEAATSLLLRLDIDEIVRARRLVAQTEVARVG